MTIRIICNLRKRESTSAYFKQLEILKLPDLYFFSLNIFMFNFANGKLPKLFDGYFTPISTIHSYATKQKQKYIIPLYRTKLGTNFVKKCGIDSFELYSNVLITVIMVRQKILHFQLPLKLKWLYKTGNRLSVDTNQMTGQQSQYHTVREIVYICS